MRVQKYIRGFILINSNEQHYVKPIIFIGQTEPRNKKYEYLFLVLLSKNSYFVKWTPKVGHGTNSFSFSPVSQMKLKVWVGRNFVEINWACFIQNLIRLFAASSFRFIPNQHVLSLWQTQHLTTHTHAQANIHTAKGVLSSQPIFCWFIHACKRPYPQHLVLANLH